MSELATLKTEGDVSIITLDDGKANVFSYPMLETLQKILSEIPKDKGSVIITGRDGMFSGGFDLKTFASGDVEQIKNMSALGFKTLFDLYTFPRPVVAAISGHAVALGIFVVCCCEPNWDRRRICGSSKRSKKQHGYSRTYYGNSSQ